MIEQQGLAAAKIKVLAVDDTATNRQILQVFLSKLGYETIAAADGAEAVRRFIDDKPDIVLMDVMMPVMDGYEATRQIKSLSGGRWVPVIFLSALDKDENLVAGLNAGGDDYLTKPINFVILDAKLRSFARTLEMQRNLDMARKQVAAIAENIIDAIVTIDEQGVINWCSPSALSMFGYGMDELVGQNVNILMPAPWRDEHDGYIARYVAGGTPKIIGIGQRQVSGRRKNGQLFPAELGVTEMMTEEGRRFIGILRDITERKTMEDRLLANAERLQRYHDDQERENQLAQDIMTRMARHTGLEDRRLHHWMAPAVNFSGDMVAGSVNRDGKLFILLADATGHGLSAAISVLPLLTSFYNMVEEGYALSEIVKLLNRNLLASLPTGRFVAATLMCFDHRQGVAEIWQGGMPETIWLARHGAVKGYLRSENLSLGIVEFDDAALVPRRLTVEEGDQLVFFTDGLVEAEDSGGAAFGMANLVSTLGAAPSDRRLEAVRTAVYAHSEYHALHDDCSLLLVDCRPPC
ncbi:MAG TPA: SpoIIE family protein phosphatase [Rhodocyclaceae bacterium]